MKAAAADSTGERILATADRLFYEHGIQAIGVDRVAAEAQVSKRTLYKHHASKDALVAAYLQRRAAHHVAASFGDPLTNLLGTFDRLARAFAGRRFRGCPFVNAVAELGGGGGDHPALAVAAAFKQQRRDWFVAQLRALGVADATALAEQFAILVDGAIAVALVRGDAAPALAARRAAVTLLEAAGVTVPAGQRAGTSLSDQS